MIDDDSGDTAAWAFPLRIRLECDNRLLGAAHEQNSHLRESPKAQQHKLRIKLPRHGPSQRPNLDSTRRGLPSLALLPQPRMPPHSFSTSDSLDSSLYGRVAKDATLARRCLWLFAPECACE